MGDFNFYKNYAETTSKFFAHTHSSPYQVARALVRTLKSERAGAFTSEKTVRAFGMGWNKKGVLVVHWPTLLQNVFRFAFEDKPAVSAFVWQFSDLIAYKSPLAYELYKRHLAHFVALKTEDDMMTMEISPDETDILLQQCNPIVHHPKMVQAFSEALHSTWPLLVDDREGAKKWAVKDTPYDFNDVSLFEVEPLDFRAFKERRATFKVPVLDGVCFPLHTRNFLLRELHRAAHLNYPKLGAVVIGDCLLIDLKTFIQYRCVSEKHYASLLPAELQHFRTSPWDAAEYYRKSFYTEYPDMVYTGGPVNFRDRIPVEWKDTNPDHIAYINVTTLKAHATRAYKLEIARGFRDPNAIPGVNEPRILEMQSPPLTDLDGRVVTLGVIKKQAYYYFRPGWYVPVTAKEYQKATQEQLRREFADTIYHKATEELFFKYTKLLAMDLGDLRKSTIFLDWMESLVKVPPSIFKQRLKEAKSNARFRNEDQRTPNYTKEEEQAIIAKLRPKMTREQKEELVDICGGRPWKKIVLKAELLRKKLIEKGVKDIDALPHCNYNAKLRKELQKEKV